MRPEEVRAVGRIAGTLLGDGVGMIGDIHRSIADRAFDAIGPAGDGVRRVHDGVRRLTYGVVGGAHRWVPTLSTAIGAAAMSPEAMPLASSRRGNTTLGAVNGLWGDRLVPADVLGIEMTVRQARADLPITDAGLAGAFPTATPRIVVFVHGLCVTEESWQPSDRKQLSHGTGSFGDRLAATGFTPVYIRYNSGLHVSDNGARLSALLEELVEAWPVPVDELVLIGHSMGGLVGRSACHQGAVAGAGWVDRVRHVFCLATPHLGAPLERAVNMLSWGLQQIPETRRIAAFLNTRSVGIKDLRFGSLLEEDWRDVDLDELLSGSAAEVPFLPHINYSFIGATITRDRRHPLGRLAGDLMVHYGSASGRRRRRQLPFHIDRGHHIGGLNHFELLTHPDVYAQLERRLTTSGGE
ncbi:MAG: lipase family alpha/beta hydrolase [Acidimicrobiia bacterium]